MPVTKDKKAEILAALIEEFKSAKSVAVAKTQGMPVGETQDFRRKLRENDVSFKIAKKTLICLAAKEAGYDVETSMFEGSIGLAFSPDEVMGAKLVKEQDPKKKKMELIALFLEGQLLDSEGANELADIPGKEQLLAKFVGMLQSPLNSFAGMLNSPLSSFARAVSAYAEQKPAEAAEQSEATNQVEAPEEAPAANSEEGKDESQEETPTPEAQTEVPTEAEAETSPAEGDAPTEDSQE